MKMLRPAAGLLSCIFLVLGALYLSSGLPPKRESSTTVADDHVVSQAEIMSHQPHLDISSMDLEKNGKPIEIGGIAPPLPNCCLTILLYTPGNSVIPLVFPDARLCRPQLGLRTCYHRLIDKQSNDMTNQETHQGALPDLSENTQFVVENAEAICY